jgi:hypothetical protein
LPVCSHEGIRPQRIEEIEIMPRIEVAAPGRELLFFAKLYWRRGSKPKENFEQKKKKTAWTRTKSRNWRKNKSEEKVEKPLNLGLDD